MKTISHKKTDRAWELVLEDDEEQHVFTWTLENPKKHTQKAIKANQVKEATAIIEFEKIRYPRIENAEQSDELL